MSSKIIVLNPADFDTLKVRGRSRNLSHTGGAAIGDTVTVKKYGFEDALTATLVSVGGKTARPVLSTQRQE